MSKNTELDAIRAELAELRARVTAGDAPLGYEVTDHAYMAMAGTAQS